MESQQSQQPPPSPRPTFVRVAAQSMPSGLSDTLAIPNQQDFSSDLQLLYLTFDPPTTPPRTTNPVTYSNPPRFIYPSPSGLEQSFSPDWQDDWSDDTSSERYSSPPAHQPQQADSWNVFQSEDNTPPPPSPRPTQEAFGQASPLLGTRPQSTWSFPAWLAPPTSPSPQSQPPPAPRPQRSTTVRTPLPSSSTPTPSLPRPHITNLFPANRSKSTKSFTWRQTPRKFSPKPGHGYGFAVTATRAVRKATKTTRLRKGGRKRVVGAQTKLRFEVRKKVRFSTKVLAYDAPYTAEELNDEVDEKKDTIFSKGLGRAEEDDLDDVILLDEDGVTDDEMLLNEAGPSMSFEDNLDPMLFSDAGIQTDEEPDSQAGDMIQAFGLQSQGSMDDTKIGTTNKSDSATLSLTNKSQPDTAKIVEPQSSFEDPIYPLIKEALANKGPLSLAVSNLIDFTLTDMEEVFRDDADDRTEVWQETADEFCGCTREDLSKWYGCLKAPVQAQKDTSESVMKLLLRAFFDGQYSLLDEIACMEDVGFDSVVGELEAEKEGVVKEFLLKARKDLEDALWGYFLSVWIKQQR